MRRHNRFRFHFPRSLTYRIPVTLLPHPYRSRNRHSRLLGIGILRTYHTHTFLLQSCTTSALSFLQLASSWLSLQLLFPLRYTGIFFQKRMAIQISSSEKYGRAEALPRKLSSCCPTFDKRMNLVLRKFEATIRKKFRCGRVHARTLSVSEQLRIPAL